jgi:hypothetical protein
LEALILDVKSPFDVTKLQSLKIDCPAIWDVDGIYKLSKLCKFYFDGPAFVVPKASP